MAYCVWHGLGMPVGLIESPQVCTQMLITYSSLINKLVGLSYIAILLTIQLILLGVHRIMGLLDVCSQHRNISCTDSNYPLRS